jgi:hypothetical protein
MKQKLKPKSAAQAAATTTGTSAALTGVIVWAYPAIQATQPHWPAMNLEAAWGLTVIITTAVNFFARMIPMRNPPLIYQEPDTETPNTGSA